MIPPPSSSLPPLLQKVPPQVVGDLDPEGLRWQTSRHILLEVLGPVGIFP